METICYTRCRVNSELLGDRDTRDRKEYSTLFQTYINLYLLVPEQQMKSLKLLAGYNTS